MDGRIRHGDGILLIRQWAVGFHLGRIFLDRLSSYQLLKNSSDHHSDGTEHNNYTDGHVESDAADDHRRDTSFHRYDHRTALPQHSTANERLDKTKLHIQTEAPQAAPRCLCNLTDTMQLNVAQLLTMTVDVTPYPM